MNRKLKVILIFAGIFVAGVITGSVLNTALLGKKEQTRIRSEQIAPRQIFRLKKKLNLTPEQIAAVQPAIDRRSQELIKARVEATRKSAHIIELMENEISKELTPEQREILVELQAAERERVQKQAKQMFAPKKPAPPKKEKDEEQKPAPKKPPQKKPAKPKPPTDSGEGS